MNAPSIIFFGVDYPPTYGGISSYSHSWVTTTAAHFTGVVECLFFGNALPRTETVTENLVIRTVYGSGVFEMAARIWFAMLVRPSASFHALNLFPIGFLTVLFGYIFHRRTIVTLYGTEAVSQKTSPIARMLKRWTINHATHVVAISEFTKNEVAQRLGIRRDIARIYPVLSVFDKSAPVEPLDDARIPKNCFLILCVCRLVRRKGVEDLISAVAGFHDDDWRVVIIGSGPERTELEQLARSRHIENRIIFMGDVVDLRPYYQRADLCVLLSHYRQIEGDFEGLGLVLIEAQQFGIPVIGTLSGGIPEAMLAGQTGLLVPEREPNAIQDAIEDIRANATRYRGNEEARNAFLTSRFGEKATIASYLTMLGFGYDR